jgi:hypothetical protein
MSSRISLDNAQAIPTIQLRAELLKLLPSQIAMMTHLFEISHNKAPARRV